MRYGAPSKRVRILPFTSQGLGSKGNADSRDPIATYAFQALSIHDGMRLVNWFGLLLTLFLGITSEGGVHAVAMIVLSGSSLLHYPT